MSKIKDFKDLRIWRNGLNLVKSIYAITKKFPKEELFGLVSQMRRSSISIPANIAEGHAKRQTKEFGRFLNMALGSCAELETLLILASELGYIDEKLSLELIEEVIAESRQISALKSQLAVYKKRENQ